MSDKALSKAEKAYVRAETRLAIAGAIVRLFEDLEKQKKLNQTALAERLGVSRARVHKLVTAPGNWTLDTVADLLAAMDAKLINVEVKHIEDILDPTAFNDWLIATDKKLPVSPRPYHLETPEQPTVSSSQTKIRHLEIA